MQIIQTLKIRCSDHGQNTGLMTVYIHKYIYIYILYIYIYICMYICICKHVYEQAAVSVFIYAMTKYPIISYNFILLYPISLCWLVSSSPLSWAVIIPNSASISSFLINRDMFLKPPDLESRSLDFPVQSTGSPRASESPLWLVAGCCVRVTPETKVNISLKCGCKPVI